MNTAAACAAAVIMRALPTASMETHKPKRGEDCKGEEISQSRHKRQ